MTNGRWWLTILAAAIGGVVSGVTLPHPYDLILTILAGAISTAAGVQVQPKKQG